MRAGELGISGAPSSRALCEVVRRLPCSVAELRTCRGFGALMVERFGDALLAVLRPQAAVGKWVPKTNYEKRHGKKWVPKRLRGK